MINSAALTLKMLPHTLCAMAIVGLEYKNDMENIWTCTKLQKTNYNNSLLMRKLHTPI